MTTKPPILRSYDSSTKGRKPLILRAFPGFSGNFPIKKKADYTRCNKKAISYYMFLYPQARPCLMRAGVCVIIPNEARAISFTG